MIKIIKSTFKTFTLLEFFNTYRDIDKEDKNLLFRKKVPLSVFTAIIKLFFVKCTQYVLEGNVLVLPIGKFKICKIIRDTSKQVVCHGATRKAKAEGKDIVIYRTNTSYHALQWRQNQFFKDADFVFKSIRPINRDIPNYFKDDILTHIQ